MMAEPFPESVLVTGATGLIGRRTLAELTGRCELWAMSRRFPNAPPSDCGSRLAAPRWIAHDFEETALPAALPPGVDTVVHLAQAEDHRDFPAGAARIHAVTANATLQLLDWAWRTGARRFILASTGGLYAPSPTAIDESSPLGIGDDPLAFYLTSKRISELLAERYAAAMTVVVLRFFFVYGPGQRPPMLLPRLIASVAEGRPLTLQGKDGIRLNPLHVDDAARAIARCCALETGATINLAGPETVSMRRIGELIGEGLGKPALFAADTAAQPRDWVAGIARMKTLLGAPLVRPETGVPEMARAFRDARIG
ncbi:NAD-dependent epimerase/dehydratase family protein [Azospirillum himalayense]|uniref:NAD-dependent epimerase/dehydratase family protein n=1 Tax=Azospirillum himalayense TaxID=654847 RepID=A0ABW0G191_9PROT